MSPLPVEYRKHDEIDDLLAMASDVSSSVPTQFISGTARDAARALSGLASWVARRVGVVRMQECMRDLARHQPAWKSGNVFMQHLPTRTDGYVDENVALIAVVTSSLAHTYQADCLRSGMAFWAVESDIAEWQKVVEG